MKKVICAISLLVLAGCETAEDDALNMARDCLNKDDPSIASQCKALVSQFTSPQAFAVKCASNFLENGLTTAKMTEALTSDESTSSNTTLSTMTLFAFATKEKAEENYTECNASNDSSLIFVGSMARMSTQIVAAGGLGSVIATGSIPTTSQMEQAIDQIDVNDVNTQTAIGEAAQNTFSSYCDGDSSTSKACTEVDKAIQNGNGNAQEIGSQLLSLLK